MNVKIKKIIFVILLLAMCLSLVACQNNTVPNSSNSSQNTNELTDDKKYEKAIEYLKNNQYNEGIGLLNEIREYKDSEELFGKASYIYGSKLFNAQDFQRAYTHLNNAKGYQDIEERKAMVDYYGGVYFANNSNSIKALEFFERTEGTNFEELATDHAVAIKKQLLTGIWIGSYTNDSGTTFQVELSYYETSGKCHIGFADRNGGYKLVSEFSGQVSLGLTKGTFSEGATYDIDFDFVSIGLMRIHADGELGTLLSGNFSKKASWEPNYKIAITYPIMSVPQLFEDDTQMETVQSQESISINVDEIKNAQKGDEVAFGEYEQDNDISTKDAVEWIVLDKSDSEIILISKYCLKYSRYDNSVVEWGKSYIRNWLNNDFFGSAFNEKEKALILETNIITNGTTTTDKVYLLSSDEATTYFANGEERVTEATRYAFYESFANSKLTFEDKKSNGWWLRDKGANQNMNSVCTVAGKDGTVETDFGMFPSNDWLLVRPVIKLSLSSENS